MSLVDGIWDCSVRSPVGDVPFIVTLRSEGDRFTGDIEGNLGTDNHCSGKIEGDTLSWSMPVAKPFPLNLKCSAVIEGDQFTGSVSASVFGKFPLKGSRRDPLPAQD